MSKLILFILGLFTLSFIWLLWARHRLLTEWRELNAKRAVILSDMAHQRDLIPYLLESSRHEEALQGPWQVLLGERSRFHTASTWVEEEAFEQKIKTFLQIAQLNTLPFLEAKKDIEDLSARIAIEKNKLTSATQNFDALKKKFPYSLASGIFGLRNIEL